MNQQLGYGEALAYLKVRLWNRTHFACRSEPMHQQLDQLWQSHLQARYGVTTECLTVVMAEWLRGR